MNLRKIKRRFKEYDGGVLKFRDYINSKTYYFELDNDGFLKIYPHVKRNKELYIVLDSMGTHKVYKTLEELQVSFPTSQVGTIFRDGLRAYGICDKQKYMTLIDNVSCSEKDTPNEPEKQINVFMYYNTEIRENKKTSTSSKSIFSYKKKQKKIRFDWDEEYMEGLRIFGNRDEAESYADDMKRKKTGKI